MFMHYHAETCLGRVSLDVLILLMQSESEITGASLQCRMLINNLPFRSGWSHLEPFGMQKYWRIIAKLRDTYVTITFVFKLNL